MQDHNRAIQIWHNNKYDCDSEERVIQLIIKEVLTLLGWDVADARECKLSKSKIDIRLYVNGAIVICIECKSLNTREFKITKCTGILESNGKHRAGDGVGQLRRYAYELKKKNKLADMCYPVITNGLRWIVFDTSFVTCPASAISTSDILLDKTITEEDFYTELSKHLKRSNFS